MPTDDCLRGECAEQIAAALTQPIHYGIAYASIGAPTASCGGNPDSTPTPTPGEVYCSHNAMAVNRAVDTLVARRLAAIPD